MTTPLDISSNNLLKEEKKKFVSKQTILRLVKDIKDVNSSSLTNDGIFYIHDSVDFLVGRAMLIGPKDTPYEGCPMLFRFNFPETYPHDPPKATFLTKDNITRFHPNYYKCGKVCLSILNTWSGERWSGCQTITSLLLTMISILTDNPYVHEPGMNGNSVAAFDYKNLVDFSCKKKIVDFLENGFPEEFKQFYEDYINYIKKNNKNISTLFESKIEEFNKSDTLEKTSCQIYNFSAKLDYKHIYSKYSNIYKEKFELK